MNVPRIRELPTNMGINVDLKDRINLARQQIAAASTAAPCSLPTQPLSARWSNGSGRSSFGPATGRVSTGSLNAGSPQVDRRHAVEPAQCSDMIAEICDMFLQREKQMVRDKNYLQNQTEVTEKMRTILVDWLVDVHLKFKLHEETFFLAVDIVDRYLMTTRVSRSQLQLVGVTALLLAAKYEEIWPPEVKDCLHISANTYTREELLRCERSICAALSFKLTVPTPFPFMARLLEVTEADSTTRSFAFFYLEHALLDYNHLRFLPSEIANACVYLSHVTLRKADPWNYTLQHYSKAKTEAFYSCAMHILDYTNQLAASKYQAVRRKYAAAKYQEVSRMLLPTELPLI